VTAPDAREIRREIRRNRRQIALLRVRSWLAPAVVTARVVGSVLQDASEDLCIRERPAAPVAERLRSRARQARDPQNWNPAHYARTWVSDVRRGRDDCRRDHPGAPADRTPARRRSR
jgi:hypothetical protein